ncbi:hypothetical protein BH10PSE13_BH10PSE13_22170 [soil metagenome]
MERINRLGPIEKLTRHIGRHGTARIARVALIGAVPPLILKTEANPDGLPIDAFDGIRKGSRLARRGHDLILVARRADKLAERLTAETGVTAQTAQRGPSPRPTILPASRNGCAATKPTELVNNAGIAGETTLVEAYAAYLTGMIDLHVLAVTRLTAAIAPRLIALGGGTIINMTSVTALMPDGFTAVYPAPRPPSSPLPMESATPRRCR